jgi:ADP-heptose:LPS heptosyltransferase
MFPGALGDFVCLLPALHWLTQRAAVDLFARSEYAELVPAGVSANSLERYEIRRLFAPGAAHDASVREFYRRYRAVYSWLGSASERFVEQLSEVTAGGARIMRFQPEIVTTHQADYYLTCVGAPAGLTAGAEPEGSPQADAERFLTDRRLADRALLALAPGSGAREKNWPAENFVAVARWWRRCTGGDVVIVIGPVEHERGGVDPLIAGEFAVAAGLTLGTVAALLRRCVAYLGNDSGVSHLAALAGVRTVVLFGPTEPRQWGPRGAKVTIIRRGLECSPCANAVMSVCPHRGCLRELSVQEVIDRLNGLPELVNLTRSEAGIRVCSSIEDESG